MCVVAELQQEAAFDTQGDAERHNPNMLFIFGCIGNEGSLCELMVFVHLPESVAMYQTCLQWVQASCKSDFSCRHLILHASAVQHLLGKDTFTSLDLNM
jgi:hypothetical protein